MDVFLQVVGGVFTAVVLSVVVLAVGLYLFIRFKFRGVLSEIARAIEAAAHGTVPPFRLHLVPAEQDDEEDDEDELQDFHAMCDSVESLGFADAGTFDDFEAGLRVRGFLSESDQTWVAVFRDFSGLVFADVVRVYQDGTCWSYGNSPDFGMAFRPEKTVRFLLGLDVAAVIAEFRAAAPQDNVRVVPLSEFQSFLEGEYASDMNWHIQRGGPDDDEIREMTRIAAEREGGDFSPQRLEEVGENVRSAWKDAIGTFLSERAIRRYHKERQHSPREKELLEYRLMAVHDRLSPRNLVELLHGWCPTEVDEEDDDPESLQIQSDLATCTGLVESGVPGREVFRRLLQNNEDRLTGYEMDYELSKPLPTQIWLRPDDDDDSERDDDDLDDDDFDDNH